MRERLPLTIVVARADNRGIGKDGELPWRIPEDLRRFKRITSGHAIIMGRKTYESIGRPLPERRNIVISRHASLALDGCEIVPSLEAAIERARETDEEPMIIGGAQIYEQALPLTTKIELTEVHREVPADTFFPELDVDEWRETAREDHEGHSFVTLVRV